MATSKDIFAGWAFAPRVFAPGAWRGLGVEVNLVDPTALDFRANDTRPHYPAQNTKPHYRAMRSQVDIASERRDAW